jgi:hypothetical protein
VKRLFQASIFITASLIAMSAFPGVIDSAVFSFAAIFTVLPLLGAWLLFICVIAVRDLHQRRPLRTSLGILSIIVAIAASAIMWLQLPRRVAFSISRPSFEAFVHTAEIPDRQSPLRQRFGFYRAEAVARDPRGGIYFRTHHGMDGLSPDQMSYGFAFQPNADGSPFGAAGYSTQRISNDWHIFSTSDDHF